MKIYKEILKYFTFIVIIGLLSGCDKDITEFGFDASLAGNITDMTGSIVSGDLTSNSLFVNILGESESVATRIRVDGKGFYQNTKLFPQPSKIWIEGGFTWAEDTIYVDLSTNKNETLNFTVSPHLSMVTPILEGTTSSTISVNYNMVENDGNVFKKGFVVVSTVSYPTRNTGSGPFYSTGSYRVYSNSGTVTMDNLESGVTYYVRTMAYTDGANHYNFSDQLIVTL